jgi:hypothetical protein
MMASTENLRLFPLRAATLLIIRFLLVKDEGNVDLYADASRLKEVH